MRVRNNFIKNGVIKKENFLNKEVKSTLKKIIRDYFRVICRPHLDKLTFNIEDEKIHRKIIKFRKKNPKRFSPSP